MTIVEGKVVSSRPVSLSTAAKILSNFATLSDDRGASHQNRAFLKRSAGAFNDLLLFHKDLKASTKKTRSPASVASTSTRADTEIRTSPIPPPHLHHHGGGGGEEGGVEQKRENAGEEGLLMQQSGSRNIKKKKKKKKDDDGEEDGDGAACNDIGNYEERVAVMEENNKNKEVQKSADERVGVDHVDGVAADVILDKAVYDSDTRHKKKDKKKKIKDGEQQHHIAGSDAEMTVEKEYPDDRIGGNKLQQHTNKIEDHRVDVENGSVKDVEVTVWKREEGSTVEKHKKMNKYAGNEGRTGDQDEDVEMTMKMSEGGLAMGNEGIENGFKIKDSERKRHKRRNKEDEAQKSENKGTQGAQSTPVKYADEKQPMDSLNDKGKGAEDEQNIVTVKNEYKEIRKRKNKEIEGFGLDGSAEQHRPHKKKKRRSEAND